MPTRKTPAAVTPSESNRSAPSGRSRGPAPAPGNGGRDVLIRNLPEDAYQLLRKIAYQSGASYGEIIAAGIRLLRDAPLSEDERDLADAVLQALNESGPLDADGIIRALSDEADR